MEEFAGRVAVVTGGASGIGLGMARRFAKEGMRVVLADVEEGALEKARSELASAGNDVLAVRTDVSSLESVEALAERVYGTFGATHVLCNNAGVAGGGAGAAIWESSARDWQWVLGVNLMGVVHGIQAFVPRMLEHEEPSHIVNTSSILGLTTGNGSIYGVSKHGVTRLTEGLYLDLRVRKAKIGVSLLCPGLIATHIVTSSRNRPDALRNEDEVVTPEMLKMRQTAQERFLEAGMPADQVGDIVFDAIRERRFYVFTHPEQKPGVERRLRSIMNEEPPRDGLAPRRAPEAPAPSSVD